MQSAGDVEFSISDPSSHVVIELHSVEIAGKPQCLEHSALAWRTPDELLDLPLAPSDRQYVEHLTAR